LLPALGEKHFLLKVNGLVHFNFEESHVFLGSYLTVLGVSRLWDLRILLIKVVRLKITIQGFIGIEKADSRLAKLLKVVVVRDEKLTLVVNLTQPFECLGRPER